GRVHDGAAGVPHQVDAVRSGHRQDAAPPDGALLETQVGDGYAVWQQFRRGHALEGVLDAQVDDASFFGHIPQDEDGVGGGQVGQRGAGGTVARDDRGRRPRRVVELTGVELLGQRLGGHALFQRRVGPDGDADVLARQPRQALPDERTGFLPGGGHQLAAAPHQGRQDPRAVVGVLVPEARAVVDPGLVDVGVERGLDALDAAGARVDGDGAARRVVHRGRAGVVVLPVAATEPTARVEQGADRADVGDVAGEVAGQSVVGRADVGVRAALDEVEHLVARHFLEEAHAALAVDAALAVERDQV